MSCTSFSMYSAFFVLSICVSCFDCNYMFFFYFYLCTFFFFFFFFFFFSSRRRHTRLTCDWSSDVCSSDLEGRVQHHGSAGDADLVDHREVPRPRIVVEGGRRQHAPVLVLLRILLLAARPAEAHRGGGVGPEQDRKSVV